MRRLDELADDEWVRQDTMERMRGLHEYRRRRFSARFSDNVDGGKSYEDRWAGYKRLLGEPI
jgi:CPA1 family monovalent cation:H+ antiporter